jgi:CHAD domain-containing protein
MLRLASDLLGQVVVDQADPPVDAAADALLSRPFRAFRKLGNRLDPSSPPTEFHALRKRTKRLRYTLEFAVNADSRLSKAFLRRLIVLQDLLGGHQDADVAVAQLRSLVDRSSLPPNVVFAMGQLAHRYAVDAADLRAGFERTYRPVVGKRWRRLHRRLSRAAQVAAPAGSASAPVTGAAAVSELPAAAGAPTPKPAEAN